MKINDNWIDKTSGKAHVFTLENRVLNTLRPHEKPSQHRINKMVKLMKSNISIPIISISKDGMILDGHCRYYAAIEVLGENKTIPVEVKNLI